MSSLRDRVFTVLDVGLYDPEEVAAELAELAARSGDLDDVPTHALRFLVEEWRSLVEEWLGDEDERAS